MVKFIRVQLEWCLPRKRVESMGSFCLMSMEFQFGKMKKVMKVDGDDGYTTM